LIQASAKISVWLLYSCEEKIRIMSALPQTISSSLAAYHEMIQKRVHELVEPLDHEQIWRRPYHYGNSVGNLLLHLTGNLNYYIGAQIARTGYVRQRDREFADSGKPKKELLSNFDRTIEMVINTIKSQSAEDWSAAYSAVGSESKDRFSMILTCAGHANHHLGQMIYLQKELMLRHARGSE
jgi:uncharacterized damage-inducible protein DinB